MLRWLAVASLLLAGCLVPAPADGPTVPASCGDRPDREREGEDWSLETLAVEVRASGPFVLHVAVPVSAGGSSVAEWVANLTSDGATARLEATERGDAIRIEGSGDAEVWSCTIQAQSPRGNGCCAEQFLHRAWTVPLDGQTGDLAVRVEGGPADVGVAYTAESNWCGADAVFNGTALTGGWTWLHGKNDGWCE